MHKKILVLQFTTGISPQQSQDCFAIMCPDVDFVFINASIHNCAELHVKDFSGIIIGGSGAFYLSKGDGKTTWLPQIFALIDQALLQNVPFLGICFGFQILALHQGATIVQQPGMAEVGTFEVITLPAATADPIFSLLPVSFLAQFIHKDSACNFPPQLELLSCSEKNSCNAFRIQNKKAWGVLFHPELNAEMMQERLALFPEYVPNAVVRESSEISGFLTIFSRM